MLSIGHIDTKQGCLMIWSLSRFKCEASKPWVDLPGIGVLMKFRGMYGYYHGQCVRKSILLCKSSPPLVSLPANNIEMYDLHEYRGIPKTQNNRCHFPKNTLLRQPFSLLCCLNTGVCAEERVNADTALQMGNQILNGLYVCDVQDYVFKNRNQVITMENIVEVSIGGEKIRIDPQVFFQCLVTAAVNSGELKAVFLYEPCSYPPALFESQHAMLEADKDALANNIWKALPMKDPELPQ